MFNWMKGLKRLARDNFLTKMTSIFVAGSMSHKLAVVIGLSALIVGVWQFLINAFVPLLISIAGIVIIQIAIKDHEALRKDDEVQESEAGRPR